MLWPTFVALGVAGHAGTIPGNPRKQVIAEGFGWWDAHGVDWLAQMVPSGTLALEQTGRMAVGPGALAVVAWRESADGWADRIGWALSPKGYVLLRLTGPLSPTRPAPVRQRR